MSDILNNVFTGDLFSTTSLTAAVNKMPHVPGQAGALGIFEPQSITTTTITIEEQDGVVRLIADTPRGAPPTRIAQARRKAITIRVPHFPTAWGIMADQIQNLRAFGGGSVLQTIEQVRDRELQSHISSLSATIEYGRIGSLKGTILDADGNTELLDLFDAFGVVQDDPYVLALTTSGTVVREKCTAIIRAIETDLGAATYEGINAFVGKNVFDKLIDHPNVTKAYENWTAATNLSAAAPRANFPFGGIRWTEYRGTVTGSSGSAVQFVGDDDGYAFPVGVPGLYQTSFAPAPYNETVNTPGLPFYAKAKVKDFDKGIEGEMQTNPITICTRPKVLKKLSKA